MTSSLPHASQSSHEASPAISVRSFSANYDPTTSHDIDESSPLFSRLASHIRSRDRERLLRRLTALASFICSILSALSAGSILAYSLYGPLFISRLHYTQYQVNAISTVAEIGTYLPVPIFGYIADRYGPRPLSAFAGILFGASYLVAAGVWRSGILASEQEEQRARHRLEPVLPGGKSELHHAQAHGWPFPVIVLAFAGVGLGTSCMYMSAVTTCAKNFGRGKHKGLALGAPIAAFGLSGMWQSQVGTRFLTEPETGELDVFKYFIFLAVLLFSVGMVGVLGLKVVDEEGMIEEAEERLERSGLLPHPSDHENQGYGAVEGSSSQKPPSLSSHQKGNATLKDTLLNAETRLFLTDPTMWLLALGFFLVSGPGETYQNNVGTLIHTAYPPSLHHFRPMTTTTKIPAYNTPSTHVALIAIASTITRVISGTISDLLAPSPSKRQRNKFHLSRLNFLIFFCILFSLALLILATPLPDYHPQLFLFASSLVGMGYGALFSLTPIVISVVWGVENFGTNWGLLATVPAPGAAIWGLVYSAVYEGHGNAGKCYGGGCYQTTFLSMAIASWVAIASWLVAWRIWRRRGVLV